MNAMRIVKTALWIAFLAGISAAGVKYVAVVETGLDERSGASAQITSAEAALITAELRREAVNNLPRDRFSVMTSETVQSMGGAVLEECSEENCVITLGARIGADYIVRGTISKFQTMLTLSVEMYETENGTLVASSDPARSEKPTELLSMAAEVSANMYRKFAGIKETGRQKETRKADKKQAKESYTANTYNNYSLDNEYKDFSTWQRMETVALNLLPGGLGSFLIMKDKVGGRNLLIANGITGVGFIVAGVYYSVSDKPTDTVMVLAGVVAAVGIYGGGIYNIYRSSTYHKPKPTAASANNFKPYDGLKLAIVPTASGDFKVLARYDYTF